MLYGFCYGTTKEYIKAYNFASVQPCDSKTKIRHCIKEKYADSIY